MRKDCVAYSLKVVLILFVMYSDTYLVPLWYLVPTIRVLNVFVGDLILLCVPLMPTSLNIFIIM